jgi:aminoglycoside phosphotransferase (APT) family kinase protein
VKKIAPKPEKVIARGRTAEVYAWQDGQVLKLFYDWCPLDWVQREATVGRLVSKLPLPTPKMIDSVQIDGRQGIIYERADGPTMLSFLVNHPWQVASLGRQLAEVQTRIHAQNGAGLGPIRPWLAQTIGRVENLPAEQKAGVLSLLDRLPDGEVVCHCDLHPDQVMMTGRGALVIDWMNAHQGDPLADVARTSIMLIYGTLPADVNWLLKMLSGVIKGAVYRSYLDRYLELNPSAKLAQIRAWMVPVAAARLAEQIEGESGPLLALISDGIKKELKV